MSWLICGSEHSLFFFLFLSLSRHQQRHTQWRVPLLPCLPQPPPLFPPPPPPLFPPFSPVHSMQFRNIPKEPRERAREARQKKDFKRQIPFLLWFSRDDTCAQQLRNAICGRSCSATCFSVMRGEIVCSLSARAVRARANFKRRGTYFNQVISFFPPSSTSSNVD